MTSRKPVGDQARAEELDRRLSSASVAVLVLIGLWLLLASLTPELSGLAWLQERLGGGGNLNRFFLGFLFLYFAGLVKEKNQLRATLRGMVALIKKHLLGRAGARLQVAIPKLVEELKNSDGAGRLLALSRLRELTGEDLGEDPASWEAWWRDHAQDFVAGREAS